MASLAIQASKKTVGARPNVGMESVLFSKPVHLDMIFLFLKGVEVASLSHICKVFAERILSNNSFLWEKLYLQDLGPEVFCVAASKFPKSKFEMYKRSFRALGLQCLRWYRVSAPGVGPAIREEFLANDVSTGTEGVRYTTGKYIFPRQGQASAVSRTMCNGAGAFVVLGGWTDRGMSDELSVLMSSMVASEAPAGTGNRSGEDDAADKKQQLSYEWISFPIQGRDRSTPVPYGHSLTAVPAGCLHPTQEALITFGGVTRGGYQGETDSMSAIRVLTPEEQNNTRHISQHFVWNNFPATDLRARAYHTATFVGYDQYLYGGFQNTLCLFGGFNRNGAMADFQMIRLSDLSEVIQTHSNFNGMPPPPRFGHSANLINGLLYIMGGSSGSSNYKGQVDGEELSDVWTLCLRNEVPFGTWTRIASQGGIPDGVLHRCHSAVVVGNTASMNKQRILCFGGGAPGVVSNSVAVYNPENNIWDADTTMEIRGNAPNPRQNHSMAVLPGGTKIVVFGGALARPYGREELGDTYILDLDGHYSSSCMEVETPAEPGGNIGAGRGRQDPTGGLPFAPQYMQLLAMLNPDDRAQMLRALFAPESDGEDNSDFDEDENDGDEE